MSDFRLSEAGIWIVISQMPFDLHFNKLSCKVVYLFGKFAENLLVLAGTFGIAVFKRPVDLTPGMLAAIRILPADQEVGASAGETME